MTVDKDKVIAELDKLRDAGVLDEIARKAFHEKFITSGFEKLDNMTNGFKEGELIIIGALPSLGKTTLAVSMVSHICFEKRYPTEFFSLEMSSTKLKSLLIPENSEANFDAPLYIVDTLNMSLDDLCTQAHGYCSRQQVKIIFIDYLGLIDHEPMFDISRSLKSLAMELKISVAALCQLPGESQEKAPTLADLGSMEQDADLVLFLHRPVNEASKMRLTDLILAKQRNGHTGVVKLGITKLLMNGEARRFVQEEEKTNEGGKNGNF